MSSNVTLNNNGTVSFTVTTTAEQLGMLLLFTAIGAVVVGFIAASQQ